MATQCLGKVVNGARCKAKTTNANGYCFQHQSQVPVTTTTTTTPTVRNNSPWPWIIGVFLLVFLCIALALGAILLKDKILALIPQPTVPPVSNPLPPQQPPAPLAPPAAGFPQTEQEVLNAIYVACPSGADCIDLKVGEIHECAGEPRGTCWAITREKDKNAHIVPFFGSNPFVCQQDGYRGSPALGFGGTGVPSGYVGRLEGITLRPCH